ncbi:hypothetical protein L9F63_019279, partial [Diploptera punctata]
TCEYIVVTGARRQENRWDPTENEQVVPEDKDTSKRLFDDAMFKLEHGNDDQKQARGVQPALARLTERRDKIWHDDYAANSALRQQFRVSSYRVSLKREKRKEKKRASEEKSVNLRSKEKGASEEKSVSLRSKVKVSLYSVHLRRKVKVHLLREKLELCNKDGAHATVVHLDMRGVYGDDCMDRSNVSRCGSEISSAQMATLQPNGLLRTGHIETGKRFQASLKIASNILGKNEGIEIIGPHANTLVSGNYSLEDN